MNNYRLREMLSRVQYIQCTDVVSYEVIMRSFNYEPERRIKQHMADKVAHEIAGKLLRGGEWQHTSVPQGEEFRVRGYWLTYEQMYRLLEEAYSLGRTEPVATPVVVLSEGGKT